MPFHRHNGVGRCAQAQREAGRRVGGPKSAEFLLHMLKNAERNAEHKGLHVDSGQ